MVSYITESSSGLRDLDNSLSIEENEEMTQISQILSQSHEPSAYAENLRLKKSQDLILLIIEKESYSNFYISLVENNTKQRYRYIKEFLDIINRILRYNINDFCCAKFYNSKTNFFLIQLSLSSKNVMPFIYRCNSYTSIFRNLNNLYKEFIHFIYSTFTINYKMINHKEEESKIIYEEDTKTNLFCELDDKLNSESFNNNMNFYESYEFFCDSLI